MDKGPGGGGGCAAGVLLTILPIVLLHYTTNKVFSSRYTTHNTPPSITITDTNYLFGPSQASLGISVWKENIVEINIVKLRSWSRSRTISKLKKRTRAFVIIQLHQPTHHPQLFKVHKNTYCQTFYVPCPMSHVQKH